MSDLKLPPRWRSLTSRTLSFPTAIDLKTNKQLGYHRAIIFRRLVRFYDSFLLLSALTAGLSVSALTFPEFHPPQRSLDGVAQGFFTSAACTAVFAVMLAVMLSFRFEGYTSVTRLDYGVAWTPLVLLDWSIMGVLLGIMCWYWRDNVGWRGELMTGVVGTILVFSIWVTWWMYQHLSRKGSLGEAEEGGVMEMKPFDGIIP